VLTLDNIGGREEVAYLSEGITEEITAQLARVPELKVISRTSAEAIGQYNLTIPQIADSLGVEHVVEGSVQLFGDQIRVTAQLIHAETDNHLWADSYNGPLADLFTLQEDIAIQVASALTSAVGGIREINEGSRTEDPVAYEAYLIGKSQMHTRSSVGMLAAVEAFERAVAQDPTYAPGYAGLAMAYGLLITYGHPELNGYDLYGLGMGMANRAIELDADAAEAYAARGYLETKALSPAEPIEADFQRALELSPNSADAHGWYGHLLVREGQHDEASAQAGKAFEIDPLHPGKRYGAAFDAIASDRYDFVIQEAQRAVALEPTLTVPYFLHALANLLDGRPDDCLNVLGDLSPGIRAMCQHSRGEVSRSMQMLDSLQSTLGSTNEPASHAEMLSYRDIAMFYAWVGDVDETLDWMERAVSWSHLAVDFRYIDSGIFDKVREDSSFQSGLERIRTRMKERLLEAAG
jgi:TolB-like protein/tetratricopeptide (TPR) repeat protein